MRTSRKAIKTQRTIMDRKLGPWLNLRKDRVPPSGWLKAIRGALGINTRQLAARLGVEHTAILQFEKNEAAGKISLESAQKVARAMRCQLIYAVIPEEPFSTLDAVLDDQALQAARMTVEKVGHSMRLEQQGIDPERANEQVKELANQLKTSMDPVLWSNGKGIKQGAKK